MEWNYAKEGKEQGRGRGAGTGKCSKGNACLTRVIAGKKEANEQHKTSARERNGKRL